MNDRFEKMLERNCPENNLKLLPCPFCGGEASVITNNMEAYSEGEKATVNICCKNAECPISAHTIGGISKTLAVKQWNTRAPQPVEQEKEGDATRACYCHWQMSSKTDSGWERVETMDNCPTHGTTQHAKEGEDNCSCELLGKCTIRENHEGCYGAIPSCFRARKP